MCVKQFFHAPIGKFNTWLKRFDITIGCDDGCDKSLETYTKKSVSDDLDLFGYMKMCKIRILNIKIELREDFEKMPKFENALLKNCPKRLK